MTTTETVSKSKYLTVRQLAAELGISQATAYRLLKSGELPAAQLGPRGAALRVPRAALEAWLWSATCAASDEEE